MSAVSVRLLYQHCPSVCSVFSEWMRDLQCASADPVCHLFQPILPHQYQHMCYLLFQYEWMHQLFILHSLSEMHGGVIPHCLLQLPVMFLALQWMWGVHCEWMHSLSRRVLNGFRQCLLDLHQLHSWMSLLHFFHSLSVLPERILQIGKYLCVLRRYRWVS